MSYISFLLLQSTQMILYQFYSHHDIMGDCDKKPMNDYYLFNCQVENCDDKCCKDNKLHDKCCKDNTLDCLSLSELAPTPVGHGCCVPSFPPMIQYNAKRHNQCHEKFGPFASSNLYSCDRSSINTKRGCQKPIAVKKLVEHRGDNSASGYIRMAKLQAVASVTGTQNHNPRCVGGCNTSYPARSYPAIEGTAIHKIGVGGATTPYCLQRFANQERTSQFILASSFSAINHSDKSTCSCD